jgi:hypothetical protein
MDGRKRRKLSNPSLKVLTQAPPAEKPIFSILNGAEFERNLIQGVKPVSPPGPVMGV